MPSYLDLTNQEITSKITRLELEYEKIKELDLRLNMTRGKPCAAQLDLVRGMQTCLADDDYLAEDGTDCRNYGGLEGIFEMRRLFAQMLQTKPESVFVAGNSSLNLMYDTIIRCLLFPLPGQTRAWSRQEGPLRFICPVPGYDRHFYICETLGIEMLTVPMTEEGPDMDLVEELVAADPAIKGMWLVPVYSNPDGFTCSEDTCRRLAAMQTAAPDFRLFWDNAYAVHHLYPDQAQGTADILSLCAAAGQPDRVFEFASTSKITWPSSGVACVAASPANLAFIQKHMAAQTIGPDKMVQLRHARFLRDLETIKQLMLGHAAIMRPKFDLVQECLSRNLDGLGICHWHQPRGGYFYSLFVLPGTAREVVRLAGELGVELTPAGSTWPGKKDPSDSNIRLAPSFPTLAELAQAMEAVCLCIKLAALRQLAGRS